MNQFKKRKLLLAALFGIATVAVADSSKRGTTYFSPRSQSLDSARDIAGLTHEINLYDMNQLYGTFYAIPEYTRSFRDERIARCLFGQSLNCECDNPTISISGSQVENRGEKDWLADYFGLPTNYRSVISFEPRVDQFLVDFGLYLGLDEWVDGLYFWIHAPVVHTRWRLNPCEQRLDSDTPRSSYAEGYFAPNAVNQQNLQQNALDFFQSRATPNLGDNITFNPLCFSRWVGPDCDRRLTETQVADLRMILGWNFFQDCDYHFGLNIQAAAPTGTKPDGVYLFEPIVGNGHHWEFGGGLSAHTTLWCSDDEDRSLLFYFIGNVTHLFKATQCRTFDLKGHGPNNRYMLAQRMTSDVTNNLQGGGTAATAQFDNVYTPVANLTHLEVKASASVQVDITAMFNYTSCGFGWDIGYNFWYRSCDKLDIDCNCPNQFDENTWALKGDARVFGFDGTMQADFVPLSATQSNATISGGSNFVAGQANPETNPNIDNPQLATGDSSGGNANNQLLASRLLGAPQVNTSIQSQFISFQDIDCDSSKTSGISHKLFTHLSYTWIDCEDWAPYFGVGAKVEFSQNNSCRTSACPDDSICDTKICEDDCPRCNLSEWGIWLKGGVSFN